MNIFVWVAVILIQACMCHRDTEEKKKLLNVYHNEDNDFQVMNVRRNLRQTNKERFKNTFVDDDWYVFDVVEENPMDRSVGRTSVNVLPRTTTTTTTTTRRPQVPNAIARRLPPCEEACNMRTTSEYNPVCGDNGVSYYNNARLDCAAFCGQSVQALHRGRCGPLLPFR